MVDKQKLNQESVEADLAEVKNLFIWDSKYIVSISRMGKVTSRTMDSKVFFDVYHNIWRKWEQALKGRDEPQVFHYPAWAITKENRFLLGLDFFFKLGILALITIFAFDSVGGFNPIFVLRALLFVCVVSFLPTFSEFLFKKPSKKYSSLSWQEDALQIGFLDGSVRKFSKEDVGNYDLSANSNCPFLMLKDGTKLLHLERVSYWPILRDKLLSKLEPSGKAVD